MKSERDLFAECASKVETEYGMHGLSYGLYEDFAWDCMRAYLNLLTIRLEDSSDTKD